MIRNPLYRGLLTLAAFALIAPAAAWAGDADKGKAIYDLNCTTCHGPSGQGDGPISAALPAESKPRDFTTADFKYDTDGDGTPGTDTDLTNIITKGAMEYGGSPLMAPLPHLSADDIANVIAYVRSLKK
jgi:mono/diheme cytochrome c family protein